jgi:NADP-dependent 3-hydroxy acid dehydrogenase YdfG
VREKDNPKAITLVIMTSNSNSKSPLTWLITGCSSGFGLAIARIAQANGHKVIATSRSPSRTPQLVDEITSKGGQWLKLDVSDADCGQVVQNLESQGTAIDVLMNNAGFSICGPVSQPTPPSELRLFESTLNDHSAGRGIQ